MIDKLHTEIRVLGEDNDTANAMIDELNTDAKDLRYIKDVANATIDEMDTEIKELKAVRDKYEQAGLSLTREVFALKAQLAEVDEGFEGLRSHHGLELDRLKADCRSGTEVLKRNADRWRRIALEFKAKLAKWEATPTIHFNADEVGGDPVRNPGDGRAWDSEMMDEFTPDPGPRHAEGGAG